MEHNKLKKLKKYLFLISVFFFITTISHLFYTYLYHDAKLVPIKGGNIYEGLIGNFPSLNPLKKDSENNEYVISLLYRGLLKYDIEKKQIVGDIANCDIENLSNISCYINDTTKWSNGKQITTADILATYKVLQNTAVNPVMQQLLLNTTIETKDDAIIFINEKKDLNFLNVLFQPIVSKEVLDSLSESQLLGNFSTSEQIYSGLFKISHIKSDATKGVTDIVLVENTNQEVSGKNLDQLTLKIFPNINTLLKNKESINIFNDKENIIGTSIPRFNSNKYILPQYVSAFINQENVTNLDLRNFILNSINRDNLIKILGEESFKAIQNPYLTEYDISKELENKNFSRIMSDLGYQKKSAILENFLPEKKQYSSEIILQKTDADYKKDLEGKILSIDEFQADSQIISSPSFVDIYNFITKDNLLLTGNVPVGVEEVYINDYKLSSFQKGGNIFYYRLRESNNNLVKGENSYKIYFVENGKKELKEEIHFLYYPNKAELEKNTTTYIEKIHLEKLKEQDQKRLEKEKSERKDISVNKDELESITQLDDNWYYNTEKNIFELNVLYISNEKYLEQTALYIKKTLEEIGIQVNLKAIRIEEIGTIMEDKSSYDIFIGGIFIGYFDGNIFPYFHSSQAKGGRNFSNIRKGDLDNFLIESKEKVYGADKTKENQEDILDILKKEQVVKTLFTPYSNLMIDKNIKNISIFDSIPHPKLRSEIFLNSYTKEKKVINIDDKGIFRFFQYLFKKVYE